MGASKVPESLLARIEKLSPEFSEDVRILREVSDKRNVQAAEKALSTRFLLTPKAAFAAQMTRGELTAMAKMAHGQGYEDPTVEE